MEFPVVVVVVVVFQCYLMVRIYSKTILHRNTMIVYYNYLCAVRFIDPLS